MTLSQWYLSVLEKYRTDLLKITSLLVADAAFSVLPFVEGLKEIGFSLISRLRSNAVLYYIYEGPRTGKRGRPKTKDGKIDFSNPDKSRMTRLDIAPEEGEAFELVAWYKSLKQKIRLVAAISNEGRVELNLKKILKAGQRITKAQLKVLIQQQYNLLGIKKTAKATDIAKFGFDTKEVKIKEGGRYINGVELYERRKF